MNDFGVFQAIAQRVREDAELGQKITQVVNEPRPGLQAPYMLVRFESCSVDIPSYIQTAFVRVVLELHSTYHGDQELHQLMSRLNQQLDGAALPVQAQSLGLPGLAVFKVVEQGITRDPARGRTATITYDTKVNIRR